TLVERALATKQAEITARKEWLIKSYFDTRQEADRMYNIALKHVDDVKNNYEQRITATQVQIDQDESMLANAQATGRHEYELHTYTNNIEYLKKELQRARENLQHST